MYRIIKNHDYHRPSFWSKKANVVGMFLAVVLIGLGAVGLILFQNPLRESQDNRQQAAVDSGKVLISASPGSGTNVIKDKATSIDLTANTQGVRVDGLELVFKVVTNTVDILDVQVLPNTGLQSVLVDVEKVSDGFLVHLIALPTFGNSFSSTNAMPVARLSFTPSQTGTMRLTFDADKSLSTVHASNPPKDELKTIAAVTYTVTTTQTASATSTPTPTPTATPKTTTTGSTSTFTATPTPTPKPTATPTPTATPASIATGGVTYKSCNQTCASNSECQANLRCYENKCRLVTNVTSESCSGPADQGLHRGCNEYCANTGECTSGFTCFYNQCRRPDNPDSSSCAVPSATVQSSIKASCNQGCTTNADCATNLRCYNNQCRLATNPGSTSCASPTSTTVSPIYTQPSTTTESQKGDDSYANSTALDSTNPSGFDSPEAASPGATTDDSFTSVLFPSPRASARPAGGGPIPTPTPAPATGIKGLLSTWPGTALVMGIILLAVIVLVAVIKAFRRPKPPTTPPGTPGGPSAGTPSQYEQQLHQRISQLQNQAVAPPPARPAAMNNPVIIRPPATYTPPTTPPYRPAVMPPSAVNSATPPATPVPGPGVPPPVTRPLPTPPVVVPPATTPPPPNPAG